ncbi:MAG: methyltransferase, partial [Spirochaetes bacterium]|nr:methyltransferase [Spirochaetota bacterium]
MGEKLSSRKRVRRALAHETTDRPPVDLGSTLVSGIQASAYSKLKDAIGAGGNDVKVYDPFQMLAEVEEDVKQALGVDTCGIQLPVNFYGYRNENWKPFSLFDKTAVLMPGDFQYDVLENGDIVQYPQGNRSVPPSGRMPNGGYYFDTIVRQPPIEEDRLDAKRWVEQT